MYVSVLENKLAVNILKYVGGAATAAGLPDASLPALCTGITAGNLITVPDMTSAVGAAVDTSLKTAYAKSSIIVFYCTIPFSVLLIATAFLVPDIWPFLCFTVAKKLQTKDGLLASRAVVVDHEKAIAAHAENATEAVPSGAGQVVEEA